MERTTPILSVKQTLLVTRIITFALIQGVLAFAAVAWFQHQDKAATPPLVAWLALGSSVISLILALFVPSVIVQFRQRRFIADLRNPQQSPPTATDLTNRIQQSLLVTFQTQTIIAQALLEGAAFFNVMAYFLEHHVWSLGVAGVLVLAIGLHFPREESLRNWLDDQSRLILDEVN